MDQPLTRTRKSFCINGDQLNGGDSKDEENIVQQSNASIINFGQLGPTFQEKPKDCFLNRIFKAQNVFYTCIYEASTNQGEEKKVRLLCK